MIPPTGDTQAEKEEERLGHSQVKALIHYGRELRLSSGASLFDERSVVDSFYVVLESAVSIFRLDGAEETHIETHRAREFTGGLGMLTGRTSVHRARAVTPPPTSRRSAWRDLPTSLIPSRWPGA